MIKSIKKVEPPETKIICHMINPTPEQRRIILNSGADPYKAYQWIVEPIDKVEMSWQIIERKASYLLKSIEMCPEALHILIDVDMVVLKPLDELEQLMKDHDMGGIVVNPEKIAGGILAVNPTTISKELLTEWDTFLMDGKFFYNKDQPSLAALYKKYLGRGLRWLQIDRRYMDHKHNENAFIWSAHKIEFGTKKERFEMYEKKLEAL
jgi:hypothetical protein